MNNFYGFVKENLLSDFELTVNRVRNQSYMLDSFTEEMSEQGVVLTFDCKQGLDFLKLSAREENDCIIFSLDARLNMNMGVAGGFAPEGALSFKLGRLKPDTLLGSHHDGTFWMYPSFISEFKDILPRTQSLLVKTGNDCYHLLPLTGDNFRCELDGGRLEISSDMSGLCRLQGDFLAVAVSSNPIAAVKCNYETARAVGAIRIPLKKEKALPEIFSGFGWCTWDAFYTELSSEKIYAKLDEFKQKGIPVKWVVIDDGWMLSRDGRLSDFAVDPEKFPEGLSATVKRMKSEYGVEKVGIWHAFNGYWLGVDTDSPLYDEQKENLFITPSGLALPSLDEEKAFAFWDSWHTYLENEGIDFLKVDNQSSNSGYIIGAISTAEGCRIAHRAIERSIEKHFGGTVINCMGMDMENTLARPMSSVSRNSDDFFPKRERGFIKHLIQNTYNAIWHDNLYYCDFDMWWSNHCESAVQSGVLRAISGSPVYVSDKIGETNREYILPLLDKDGKLMLCDGACMPTLDCVFTDCVSERKHLKVYNRSDDCFALAAFNVNDGEVSDIVDFSQIPELVPDTDYVAYEYFSKKFTLISTDTKIQLSLPRDGVAVWSIYPICGAEKYIMLGDTEKYVPIASAYKEKKALADIELN